MYQDRYENMIKVLEKVFEASGVPKGTIPEQDIDGRTLCPLCQTPDALSYTVLASNGHIGAKCDQGCIVLAT